MRAFTPYTEPRRHAQGVLWAHPRLGAGAFPIRSEARWGQMGPGGDQAIAIAAWDTKVMPCWSIAAA